nr:uncharacterized protein LOC101883046 [Danio rerio]XP_021332302.1 uncharacterized protein LOC101883046 [Danio rerio]|eukprot:XP_021326880.1 uncharacterized protein LOC101883046 [Danio rerio]
MQRLENLLQESETITLEDPPEDTILQSPLSIWGQRKKEVQQCWQEARPQNLANLLSAERIPTMTCSHCHVREAIIRCRECLPSEWFCECCDTLIHKHHILHSSPGVIDFERSGYWPATMQAQTLFHQDLFHLFEAMKTAAPGMSVKAFTALLDQRTKQFGRTGKVNADAFQRSFLQYVYCNSEQNQLLGKEPFLCPACSPEMVAVSVDGNRKLYRFQKTNH